jgi:hypothetical protein
MCGRIGKIEIRVEKMSISMNIKVGKGKELLPVYNKY